jgi:tRNA modification GTPase
MLIDTAGLREAEGRVEAEGISRALARAGGADLVLWLVDATAPLWDAPAGLAPDKPGRTRTNPEVIPVKPRVIPVLNKIDLAPGARAGREAVRVSAKTGEGIGVLVETLAERAATAAQSGAGAPALTRTRHRVELAAAAAALERFGAPSLSPELKAEELRIAANHLGRLTGRIDVEDVLGAIFAEFCIGK